MFRPLERLQRQPPAAVDGVQMLTPHVLSRRFPHRGTGYRVGLSPTAVACLSAN